MRMPSIRQEPVVTIAELKDQIREDYRGAVPQDIDMSDVEFHLGDNDPHFRIKGKDVPASQTGVKAFASFFKIPDKYWDRLGTELGVEFQGELLEKHHEVAGHGAVSLTVGDSGVLSVDKAGRQVIYPQQLVAVAEKVVGTDKAEIVRLINTPSEFAFDVHVPESWDHGIGGDIPKKDDPQVGDITAGGIGISYNRKLNHAPETNTYLYRLICTNGMRTQDPSLKVSARGHSVDDVLLDLEVKAALAFSRVEEQIRHFYGLREKRVDNPERILNKLAAEHKIPDRSLKALMALAPSEELPDEVTEFDIANLITNYANDMQNDGGRLLLESIGGSMIRDEAVRCGHCLSAVAH